VDTRLTTLIFKKISCSEIERCENRMTNLAESSKEGYGSKRAALPMMMMMMMMVVVHF
jgi:hypothetical protein